MLVVFGGMTSGRFFGYLGNNAEVAKGKKQGMVIDLGRRFLIGKFRWESNSIMISVPAHLVIGLSTKFPIFSGRNPYPQMT
jgi:hypothetical protein